ncbi:MAG TPA: hypothetical protein VMT27_09795, partial [Actinomycetes bacterium]|nr:hypothetical protein [Actinomycetes bacterium]
MTIHRHRSALVKAIRYTLVTAIVLVVVFCMVAISAAGGIHTNRLVVDRHGMVSYSILPHCV